MFFTDAGMSAERGLQISRGEGGNWNDIDAKVVVSKSTWY